MNISYFLHSVTVIALAVFMHGSNAIYASTAMYAFTTLPGTVIHELCHFMMALFLNGNPSNFSIIPTGDTLGSIQFHPNYYNAASVALAPFLMFPGMFLFAKFAEKSNFMLKAFFIYCGACCFLSGIPSSTDFHIAASYPSSWIFVIPCLVFPIYFGYKLALRGLVK